MTVKTEGPHSGGFIVSEANGHRSREIITIAAGQVLQAGAVLAVLAGVYEEYNNDASFNAAAAILLDNVDASDGAVRATALVRDCEVNGGELVFADSEDSGDRDAAVADLKALGIIVRGNVYP
jgi:hypothetical protein